MKRTSTAVLLLIVAGSILSQGIGEMKTYKCVHDTLFKDLVPQVANDMPAEHERILQTSGGSTSSGTTSGSTSTTGSNTTTVVDGWHKFRITIDFSYADALIAKNANLNAQYQLSVRLMESVRSYFGRYFQVNYFPSMSFAGGSCQNNKVPAFNRPTDLYITIVAENDPSTDYFAAAAGCYLSTRDKRPIVGAYILNFAFLETAYYHEFLYFSTFAHEFTHILGFSNNLFKYFVKPGTLTPRTDVTGSATIGSESFNTITMSEVVTYARTFFGCNNIPGMPLENNGGDGSAGSHWEKLFLPQEYMNPTVENPGILSEFTMTFLRATGWYQVSSSAAQRYDWGQYAGCNYFNICPQNSTGYCSAAQSGQTICSSEWMSKGSCSKDSTFSSGCFVKRSQEHSCLLSGVWSASATESYGLGSRCLNFKGSSGYIAQCQKVTCSSTGISITVGSKTVTCGVADAGKTIDVGLTASLECPNYSDFCNEFNARCTNDCSAGGLCTGAQECMCYTGFSGSDCSTKATVDYSTIKSLDYTGKNAMVFLASLFTVVLAMLTNF